MATNRRKTARKHGLEYFIINLFIFGCIGILSIVVFNLKIFDPFTEAFRDFTLTDIYYQKARNNNDIYKDHLVIVNIEKRNRNEIDSLLRRLEEGRPKVIGVDAIFPDKKDSADALLKQTFHTYNNIVLPYIASFSEDVYEVKNNDYFEVPANSFVNVVGQQPEISTVRYYYPVYRNIPAFTTAIMQLYDSALAAPLLKRKDKKTEIRYYGNAPNFTHYSFEEVMKNDFDIPSLKDKIVLIGYMGVAPERSTNYLDEDRYFTPLNEKLSGRSYPDMYGVILNANILRMALDRTRFIVTFPSWINWLLAFLLSWIFIPIYIKWWVHTAVWFHLITALMQLLISMFLVFFSIGLYAWNLKLEPATLLIAILFLGDFILIYDSLVKFLKHKLQWNFHSIFFEGAH